MRKTAFKETIVVDQKTKKTKNAKEEGDDDGLIYTREDTNQKVEMREKSNVWFKTSRIRWRRLAE